MPYWNPYATPSNLRNGTALAHAGLGDATSQTLAQKYRQIAVELGVTLPARPAGLSDAANMVFDTLEALEVADAILRDLSTRYFHMFQKGGMVCEDLLEYNALAVRVYEVQRDMLAEFRNDGVGGLPHNPPLPVLFQGHGILSPTHSDRPWEINCDPDNRIVGWVTNENPNGIGLIEPSACPPCGTSELQGAFTTALLIGAGIGAVAYLFKKSADKEKLRQESNQIVASLWLLRWLEELQDQRTDRCVKDGKGTYAQCLAEVEKSLPTPEQITAVIEEVKKNRQGAGRSWLWWLGVGTVIAVGVGAIIWWRRGKGGSRAVTVIDAD